MSGHACPAVSVVAHAHGGVLCCACSDLTENGVRWGDGTAALAAALQHLTGLSKLDLQGCRLRSDGMAALAPALQQLTGVRELWVGSGWDIPLLPSSQLKQPCGCTTSASVQACWVAVAEKKQGAGQRTAQCHW